VGTNSVMDGDASLDPLIESELQAHRVPGCSIALVNEERVVWSAGYGTAVLRSGRPATPDSVYHLFSVTKLFTAVAVLKLVERGALGLDHVLGRYLPEEKAAQAITIEHLLSHRSGLKDTLRAFLAVRTAGEKPLTSREALSTYRLKATRRPGERVEYRNVNYALLGEVITRVSGMEYTRFVTTAILDPLGAQLSFDVTAEMRDRASTGYLHTTDPMRFLLRWLLPDQMRQLYGDRHAGFIALREFTLSTASIGGLVGSVLECAKFLRAQLAPDPRVLSEALTRRMQTKVAEGVAGIESRAGMALGWKVGSADGRVFLNHEGGGAGFTSELRLYPEERHGIALAMNAMRMPRTMRLAHRICEAVMHSRVRRRT